MHKTQDPFSPLQVDNLNQSQVSLTSFNPFTCPNRSEGVVYSEWSTDYSAATHSKEGGYRGLLIATDSGWVCPHCGYTQDWAPTSVAERGKDECKFYSSFKSDSIIFLLHQLNLVISDYESLRLTHRLSDSQTNEQNEKTQRIWTVVPFMLASLRRRRLAHFGIQVTPDKLLSSVNVSWHDLAISKPADNVPVHVLWQDQPYTPLNALGGVSNPGHDGYGCNVWIDVREFHQGAVLSVGGGATHWREIGALSA